MWCNNFIVTFMTRNRDCAYITSDSCHCIVMIYYILDWVQWDGHLLSLGLLKQYEIQTDINAFLWLAGNVALWFCVYIHAVTLYTNFRKLPMTVKFTNVVLALLNPAVPKKLSPGKFLSTKLLLTPQHVSPSHYQLFTVCKVDIQVFHRS